MILSFTMYTFCWGKTRFSKKSIPSTRTNGLCSPGVFSFVCRMLQFGALEREGLMT